MDNLTFTFIVIGIILISGFGIAYFSEHQKRSRHSH